MTAEPPRAASAGGAPGAARPSVIVATHEQPAWLELVLWGYASQTHRDFELVVADDGSGPATRETIERFTAASGRAVVHVWHEDRGRRRPEILNRAILASSGEYLVFTDGASIPRADFLAAHVRLARPGCYVCGGTVSLGAAGTGRVTVDDVCTGRIADPRWLRASGVRAWRAAALGRHPLAGPLLDRVSRRPARFDGRAAATWRTLLVAANGFDMAMTFGDEDNALGVRLEHMGVRGVRARRRAAVFRLELGPAFRTDDALRHNRAIVARIRDRREVRAPRGLAELPLADAGATARATRGAR